MGIDEGMTIGRAVHLYNKVVNTNNQERRAERLEKKLAPSQTESLFPQDKITLSSQKENSESSPKSSSQSTDYYLASSQRKKIIDIYA